MKTEGEGKTRPENLQGPSGVVPGGAGEGQHERELRPALGQVRHRQRRVKDPDGVLKEDVDLLGAADRPHVAVDVLVLPKRLAFPKIWEKRIVLKDHVRYC